MLLKFIFLFYIKLYLAKIILFPPFFPRNPLEKIRLFH
jgi:hypothetical protein